MRKIRVVVFPPALNDPVWEPFTFLFDRGLVDAGVEVVDYSRHRDALLGADVLHVHFPEFLLFPDSSGARRAIKELLKILRAKRHGTKLVWTVHDLRPHENETAFVTFALRRGFVPMVDGFAVMSESSIALVEQRYPSLRAKPRVITRQGPFTTVYPHDLTRAEARRRLGIPDGTVVALAFGQVRAYKGIPELLRAFAGIDDPNLRLMVVGRPFPEDLGREVERLAAADPRVFTRLEYVERTEVPLYYLAADLAVLNHAERSVLNSGSALLALNFGLPVLAPAHGSLPELRERTGDWVTLFDVLDAQVLRDALEDARTPRGASTLGLDDWSAHAQSIIGLYERLVQRSPDR